MYGCGCKALGDRLAALGQNHVSKNTYSTLHKYSPPSVNKNPSEAEFAIFLPRFNKGHDGDGEFGELCDI